MIQIFQFDQKTVCEILIGYLNSHGHKICSDDIDNAQLKEIQPDGTTEYIGGQIQLVIDENED